MSPIQTHGSDRARALRVMAIATVVALAACSGDPTGPSATDKNNHSSLPTFDELRTQLQTVVADNNGGLGFNMWASIVDRNGVVRAVVFSGDVAGDQWPGSRVISAQKANTANSFSLGDVLPAGDLALSTANLYSAVQPGGSLFGLQESNPVDPNVAYGGNPKNYGTKNDFMVGKRVGGINVFGGGLALYDSRGTLVGGLGVSGDFSCADHIIAWKLRHNLQLDFVPAGVADGGKDDNIIHDIDPQTGKSASGFGHPICDAAANQDLPGSMKTIALALPQTFPIRVVTP